MKLWKWNQPISEEICKSKYLLRNETIEQAFAEIAQRIAKPERKYHLFSGKKKAAVFEGQIYDMLMGGRLLPAGRILSNLRLKTTVENYSNCFTIDIKDNIDGIYKALWEDAKIGKVGGGVGLDISSIRYKDAPISIGGKSSGTISFLGIFDASAKTIQTGGGRRGAHICLMSASHPDIEEFITSKQGDKNKKLTQFNISVKISDKFMQAVKTDQNWDLEFDGKIIRTVKASYLFDMLTKNAYYNNEPGVFFEDTVERYNNGYYGLKLDTVNPCGELVLPKYGQCSLSHLNLSKYVLRGTNTEYDFDIGTFQRDVKLAVRFLDNLLDIQESPLPQIRDNVRDWRRIGLGITALGDTLAMLGFQYGSRSSKRFVARIARVLRDTAYEASMELAKEKGTFPKCNKKLLSKSRFIARLPKRLRDSIRKYGLRNVGLLTIAPTGTTSLTIGQNCSSGIEPIFSLEYFRNIRTGKGDETRKEKVYNNAWFEYLRTHDDKNPPPAFQTTASSGTIDIYNEIDIQAIFQRYIDHSISKTLTLPKGTTLEEYRKIFLYAYEKGLKGMTTFNPEGSMKGVLETGESGSKIDGDCERVTPKRPLDLDCDIHQVTSGGEKILAIVGKRAGKPYEIFVTDNSKGKINLERHKTGLIRRIKQGHYDLIVSNGDEKVLVEDITNVFAKYKETYGTLARMISMSLRHEVPIQFIVEQLQRDSGFISFERAISRILKKYIPDGQETKEKCPECGATMIFREGCKSCTCGYSKCS